MRQKYTQMDDDNLKDTVKHLHEEFPNAGSQVNHDQSLFHKSLYIICKTCHVPVNCESVKVQCH